MATKRITAAAIEAYMKDTVRQGFCVDCGEVLCTRLAEDAADHFNDFGADYAVPERYFEMAVVVADWYAKQVRLGKI